MIKFGTDGWRAVIAQDYTFGNVKIVSQAIADYLRGESKASKKVVIGYDTRFLSEEFAKTVACVLAANNIKVTLSDRCLPTPAVSFHARYSRYDLGVVITASHNPASFNGLKIKTKEGGSADKSITDAVEKLMRKNKCKFLEIEEAKRRNLVEVKDLSKAYVRFLQKFVDRGRIKKLKVKVLLDLMYGAGDEFIEKILGKSNVKIDYLHKERDPSFGGINPEPVEKNLGELVKKVKKDKYDLGIALDGDADRIAMIDSSGNYIDAQVLLPLLGIHMIKNRGASGGIGKTIVGSNLIDKVALSLGVSCYETPVGFKYLSNLFKENLICVGGEEAGGIGYKGYIPERDGSLSFLLILEMLAYEGRSFGRLLSDLYKKYGKWYYSRTAIGLKNVKKGLEDLQLPRQLYGKKIERVNTLDGIKLITKDNWLMFRKSGTEPIVRVYAESKSAKEARRLVSLGESMIYAL
ncbi:MAG: phosphoglucomutase/phosphomannomutase family protein [Candidatus Omnitrophota bacterium]|nr:MAG: phosphoglucomutase/phosphomannomutase family protein [Candidatus Omnitrophota bacterium]